MKWNCTVTKAFKEWFFGVGLNGSLCNFISFIGWLRRGLGYDVLGNGDGMNSNVMQFHFIHWFGYALAGLRRGCLRRGLVTRGLDATSLGFVRIW